MATKEKTEEEEEARLEAPADVIRFALESAGEAYWAFSPGSGEVYVTPAFYTLLGYSPDDGPRGRELLADLLHPDDAEPTTTALRQAITAGEESLSLEFRLRTADSSHRTFLCRGVTVRRDERGRAARLIGTVTDITERRAAEAAHRESEERYRQLVESQGEGIGIVDGEERFSFANPAGEAIFGVGPGGLIGLSLKDFVDAGQYERILQQTERRREGARDTYEMDLVRPDGGRRTILVTATKRHAADGSYAGAFGIFRDITDRKRAEQAVRESEERYRQLIDSLPHAVAVVTREAIRFVSRTTVRMLGYEREDELVGKDPLVFLAPGEVAHVRGKLAGLASGAVEGPVRYFARGRRKDRSEVPLEVFVSLVTYEGTPAFQVFMMDVSEREEAERRRAQLEERLQQAQKMESIGRLAGGIAHDFNNMLAPILSLAESALSGAARGSPLEEDLHIIIESAERARDLTKQLLAFGRKQLLRMRVVDLNQVITESHAMLRRLIPEDTTIALELDSGAGAVLADPAQLHQIVMDLALNARDAMPGGGRMTLVTQHVVVDAARASASAGLEPGSYAALVVTDEGCGMDAETLSRIFEPFFSTKGKGHGSGLGLATVHGIVKQHGGHIEVESTPGQGSRFTVLFKRVEGTPTARERPSLPRESSPRRATVLVAEDDTAVRRSACRILSRHGFDTIEARDGEEALVLARSHEGPIDLLLSDVIMPRVNGLELAQRLAVVRPRTTVVFMSGYADDVVARTGAFQEGTYFLQKPFTMQSLVDMVEEALRAHDAAGPG